MARTTAPASLDDARTWRKVLARLHPDTGGTEELFVFGQAVREHVQGGAASAGAAATPPPQPPPPAAAGHAPPRKRKRRDHVVFDTALPFEELTRRALELAGSEAVEHPHGWLLGLLEGCEAPGEDAPAHLHLEAQQGAKYRRLNRAGRAVGLDTMGRGRLYALAKQVPLSDLHARWILDRLDEGRRP